MLKRTQALLSRWFGRNARSSARQQLVTKRRKSFLEPLEDRNLMATFHVALSGLDTNPGTSGAPFRTIQAAITAASNTVDGNDIVNVATGVYNTVGVDQRFDIGSSASPPVGLSNLQLLGGWDTSFATRNPAATPTDYTFTNAVPPTNRYDIAVYQANTLIDGFTLRSSNGVAIRQADTVQVEAANLTFSNNILYLGSGPSGGGRATGVVTSNGVNSVSGLQVLNNQFNANYTGGTPGSPTYAVGVFLNPTALSSNLLIDGNTFQGNNFASMVDIKGQGGLTVTNNTFTRSFPATGFQAIQIRNSGFVGTTSNVTIDSNTLNGSGTGVGIAIGDGGSQNISNLNVTRNVLQNHVSNLPANDGAAMYVLPGSGQIAATVQYNQFQGNSLGFYRFAPTGAGSINIDATKNWWGSISGPTVASNPGGLGQVINDATNIAISPWLIYNNDASAAAGFQLPTTVTVTPGSDTSAADNAFRRLDNAIRSAATGQTIDIQGTFDWTAANAAAGYAASVANSDTSDIKGIEIPDGVNNLTITSSTSTGRIIGGGDASSFESFVFTDDNWSGNGGSNAVGNTNLTIEKLKIDDFENAVMMGWNATGSYPGTKIRNNQVSLAGDDSDTQNIAFYMSYGPNQQLTGNTVTFQGAGTRVVGSGARSFGFQNNTSGGALYDGLLIDGNTFQVGATSTGETIYGIWENGHNDDNSSDIAISNNQFLGRTGDLFDRAFYLSSQTTGLLVDSNILTDVDNVFFMNDNGGPSAGDTFRFTNNTLTRVGGADGVFLTNASSVSPLNFLWNTNNTIDGFTGVRGLNELSTQATGSSRPTGAATELNNVTGVGPLTNVYVDDNWGAPNRFTNPIGLASSTQPVAYGFNTQNSIAAGIAAIDAGGNLFIRSGSYAESLDTSSKSVNINPGNSPGQVSVNGIALDNNDTLTLELNGTNPASDFDNFLVTGSVSLGTANLVLQINQNPASGIFRIIDNDGVDAVTGTFAGLANNSTFLVSGIPVTIKYDGGDGNDVVLTIATPTQTWVNDNWVITTDVSPAGLSTGDTVANTGSGDNGTVTGKTYGYNAFSTVQQGVNAVPATGTVFVLNNAGGSYNENVTINKAVTLTGETVTLGAANKFILASGANVTGSGGITAPTVDVQAGAKINDGILLVGVGGKVNVSAGSYNEDVTVNKNGVQLLGAGAATTTISGPIGGGGSTVSITASNVEVAGLTITRDGNNVSDWNNVGLNSGGVTLQGASITGALVHDNIITGMRTAIDINDSSGHTIRNNRITNNRTGLIFRNQTDNMTVVENEITDNFTVGILFLDASGGTNSPVQSALNGNFSNNNISGNWYGGIVDRQSGGSVPAPGTTNLKNFSGNWFGTATPVVTALDSAEPGYAVQIPVMFGGTATPPGSAPDIAGPASANFDITPYLNSGADTNTETTLGRGTFGFQGSNNSLTATAALAQTGAIGRIQEAVNQLTASGTIIATSGVYAESVDFNKALTLNGPNVGIAGTGVRGAEAAITGNSLVTSAAGPVIIDGMKFTNAVAGGNTLWLQTAPGHIVTNSVFESSIAGGGGGDRAINLNAFGAGTSFTITNNLIAGNGTFTATDRFGTAAWDRGIYSPGQNSTAVISNNRLQNVRTGIALDDFPNGVATVNGNTIVNAGTGLAVNEAAPFLGRIGALTSITNNTFDNVDTDFNLRNLTGNPVFNLAATGNAAASGQALLVLGGSGDETIVGTSGIDHLIGDNHPTLGALNDSNTFTGGAGDDYLRGAFENGIDRALYAATITLASLSPAAIPATAGFSAQNGWLVATGGAEGTDSLVEVEIVDGAEAGRFLLVGNGGFATIQAAANAAVNGDTIVIQSGTYVENVSIGVNVTLAPLAGVSILPAAGNALTITAGTTRVLGTLTTGTFGTVVQSGGTLGGTGNITGPVTANAGGFIDPGFSPGIFATGTYSQAGTLNIEIVNPAVIPVAGSNYDQLQVTGTVTLGGPLNLVFTGAGTVANFTSFKIIDNDGTADPVSGVFTGLSNGATFTANGQNWAVFYNGGDGNDVVIVAVPLATPTTTYAEDTAWNSLTFGSAIADADFTTAGNQPAIYGYDAFNSIQAAVNAVAASGNVVVNAGTYVESITIPKALTLRGPNAGIDPNTGVRAAEAIVLPTVSNPDPNSPTSSTIIYVQTNNVTIDGIAVDGDNPALAGGVTQNGANVDAIEAISSYEGVGNITVRNNIVRNLSYTGVDFYNFVSDNATTNNTIQHNKFDNIGYQPYGFGMAVLIYNNFYAAVTDNVMTNVRLGVQTGNFSTANPNVAFTPTISNNNISAAKTGIFHNLAYSNASNFTISNNQIAMVNEVGSTRSNGIFIASLQGTVGVTLSNNAITSVPTAYPTAGYRFWGNPTTSSLVVNGGSISGTQNGVWVDNFDAGFGNGASTAVTVSGVNINATQNGVYVLDNALNTNGATSSATVQGNTTITGAAVGVLVEGSDASAVVQNNSIYGNSTGIRFSGGSGSVTNNDFDDVTDNGTDLQLTATAGTVTLGANNQFAGDTFFIDVQSTQSFNLAGNGTTFDLANNFRIEDKMHHRLDTDLAVTVGLVTWVTGNVYVTDAGTDHSVQRGVDAASSGNTINVEAGTYVGTVSISGKNNLQLLGAGNNLVTGSVLTGPNGSPANTATLSLGSTTGTTIDGFVITRDGNNTANWAANGMTYGVLFNGATNSTLQNSLVTGNRSGIDLRNGASGNTIKNNRIDFNRTGILVNDLVTNNLIQENFITNNWTAGILFLDTTTPATGNVFTNNNISGNWYTQVEDRRATGAARDLSGNWFGTTTITTTSALAGEPGYAAQVPVAYGGTAVPSATPLLISGPGHTNIDFSPYLASGTDLDANPNNGFQGDFATLYVSAAGAQVQSGGRINEGVSRLTSPGTLRVLSGTYAENALTAGKSVTLAPGASPGQVTINGNLTLDGNDTLAIEVNGTVAATDYDNLIVNGVVTLGGANLTISGTYVPAAADSFTLIANDAADAVSGTFNSLPLGTLVNVNGTQKRIFYTGNDGNDVILASDIPATTYVSNSLFAGKVTGDFILDADAGTTGDQSAIFNYNAFTSVAAAQAATTASGTIIVNGGTYAVAVVGSGTQTIEITGPNTAQAVTFNSLATAAGQNVIIEGTSTLTIGDGTATTVASIISGSGSLVKQGAAIVTLSGANTYTGATNVNAGTLKAGNTTALGGAGTGTTVAVGASVDVSGLTIAEPFTISGNGVSANGAIANTGGTASLTGTITSADNAAQIGGSGGGGFVLSSVDTATFTIVINSSSATTIQSLTGSGSLAKWNGATATLNGNNTTYTGITTVNGGTLTLGNAGALGTATGGTEIRRFNDGSRGTLNLNGFTIAENLSFDDWAQAGPTLGSGGFLVNSSGTTAVVNGTTTFTKHGTIGSAAGTGAIQFAGGITGSQNMLVQNGATAILPTANATYTGAATIANASTVQLTNLNGLQAASSVTVQSGGTLDLPASGNYPAIATSISGAGTGGTNGAIRLSNGANWQGAITLAAASTVRALSNGNATLSGAIGQTGGAQALTIDVVSGANGIINLTGASNYTGATTVSGGRLNVNGSITSATSVATGAILGGTGSITGNVTGTGTFTPGTTTPGILSITGSFNPTGTVNFEVNSTWTTAGTDYDRFVVVGGVNLTGSTLTFTNNNDLTAPAALSMLTLIDNDTAGDLTTAATSPVNGATVTIGSRSFKLFYNGQDGNNVVLVEGSTPNVVYVEDTLWNALTTGTNIADADFGTTGNQAAIYGVNAFNNITAALAAVSNTGTVIVNGGTYAEAVVSSNSKAIEVTGPDAAQSVVINSLATAAGQNVIIEGSSILSVGDGTNTSIASSISGSGSLVKQGNGTVTLNGANTYSGLTTVNAGTLLVNGTNGGPSAVNVNNSAVLGGTGSITGAVNINSTARFAPGDAGAQDLATGAVTFISTSFFDVEIGGTTPASLHDQVNVTGLVTLAGATLNLQKINSFNVNSGVAQQFVIITNDLSDAVVGTFNGLPEGAPISYAGGTVYVSYSGGDGNDVVLYSQPTVNGTPGADTLVLRQFNGTQDEYSLNGAPFVAITNTLPFTFNGLTGIDLMLVDTSNGDPIPTGNASFNGELLRIQKNIGVASDSVTYVPSTTAGSGTVSHASFGDILFTGTTNVDFVNLTTVNVQTATLADTLSVADGNTASNSGTVPGTYSITPAAALAVTGANSIVGLRNVTNASLTTTTGGGDGNDGVTINTSTGAHGITNFAVATGAGTDTVTVTGALTVSGNINIGSQSIVVNNTLTGGAASTVTLNAGTGAITTGAGIDVVAQDLVASATIGIDLDTNVTNITATNSGSGAVIIDEANGANVLIVSTVTGAATVTSATGNLNVTTVSASTSVSLTATAGSITDANGGTSNISASSLSATAQTGIDLDTTITTLTSANVTGIGAIDISDLAGGLIVTSATTTDGAITLNATGGDLTLTTVTAGGTGRNITATTTTSGNILVALVDAAGDNISLTAAAGGAINETAADAAADMVAGTATLTGPAGIGNLGTIEVNFTTLTSASTTGAATAIDLSDLAGGLVVTSATTTDGAITLNATSGDLTLTAITAGGTGRNITATTTTSGNILVALVDASGDTISLTGVGNISETATDAGADLLAATATLSAASGIGSGNALETTIDTLTATNSTSANIEIAETDAITLSSVVQSADNDANDILVTAGGTITVGTVTAGATVGDVTLTATVGSIIDNTGDSVVDITGDVVTLTAAAGVGESAGAGSLDTSANSLDVSVTSAGLINLAEANAVSLTDIDTQNGPITITAAGTITATDVASLTDNDANDISISASVGNIIVGVITAGSANGDVTLLSTAGSITDNTGDATADVIGDLVTLTAALGIGETLGNGSLDTTANSLDVSVTGVGLINLAETDAVTLTDIDTQNGSVTIIAGGTITATDVASITDNDANDIAITATTGNIIVGVITAGTANGDVSLLSSLGSITDNTNDASADVIGDVVTMTAATGVGESAAFGSLDTTANSLDVSVTGNGLINLAETNAVTLTDIDTQNGPITITAAGAITATDVASLTDNDANDIAITASSGNIVIGLVTAGPNNGDVTLIATAGTITDNTNDAVADVIGDFVTMTAATAVGEAAGNGSIDTTANSLDVSVTSAGSIFINETNAVTLVDVDTFNGSITITAAGTITATDVASLTDATNVITLTATTGNILVDLVTAGGDTVLLNAAGSIDEVTPSDAAADVIGSVLNFTAVIGIGGGGTIEINTVTTASRGLTANVTAAGPIDLLDTTGGLRVLSATTANGPITIAATTGTIIAESVTSTTNADANDITLTAFAGGIDVGTISAGNAGDVFLTAFTAITDLDATNPDITADDIVLLAGTGVATSADPLETVSSNLESSGGTGGVYVANTGALTIGGIGATVGLSATGGTILVTTTGALTVSENVTATGAGTSVTLTAIDAVAAGQNLVLNAGVTISSALSSITLNAGDNAIISGNLSSGTITTINVDFGDAESVGATATVGDGGTVTITGTITTPNTAAGGTFLNGGNDYDTFTFNPQTTTAFYVDGDLPGAGLVGDVLQMDVTGTSNPNLTVPGNATVFNGKTYNGPGSGIWSFDPNHREVRFKSIEEPQITGPYHLTYDNTTSPVGNLVIMLDGAASPNEKLQFRDGSVGGTILYQTPLTPILSVRVLGGTGADTVTIDDINGLPSFAGSVPASTGVSNNTFIGDTDATPLPEFFFDAGGGAGVNTLTFNLTRASTLQQWALGTGTGAAGSNEGEVQSTNGTTGLNSYVRNVNEINRTGLGATPGALTVFGDNLNNTINIANNTGETRISASGYPSFDLSGNNYSSFVVNAQGGDDTVDLISFGSGQTNNWPITLNGNANDDTIRVRSTSGNTNTVSLNGNAGNDTFQLYDGTTTAGTVDNIAGPVVVDGTDGNVANNTDTLTIIDNSDVTFDSVLVSAVNPGANADYAVEGINGLAGNDVTFRNVDVLSYTGTQGNDIIDGQFVSTATPHDLNTVTLNGWTGADQFLLFESDQLGGTGAGVTPTGVASGVGMINLNGDAPGNPNAGDGNDVFGATPAGVIGTGVMNVGLVVSTDTRMIRPSATTGLTINGGQPSGLFPPQGDQIGDKLNLDITALPNTNYVIVSTFLPGTVVATGIAATNWSQIEDMNLVDQNKLTNVQMGDLFARTTPSQDLIQFSRNPTPTNPSQVRLRITATIGDYSASNKTIVYAGGMNDTITQADLTIPAEFYGEDGNDNLSGGIANDWLVGGLGNDRINASRGDNVVWGDNSPTLPTDPQPQDLAVGGNDILSGLEGADVFYGGGGDDQVSAGGGNDYAYGGQGNDTLDGNEGDDRLYGGLGNDTISGFAGNDLLVGNANDDKLYGQEGNDVLFGGTGADQLDGGTGNDLLVSGRVGIEDSSWTALASTGTYSAATYTNGADNDFALISLLAQWGTLSDRGLLGTSPSITHDGDNDDLFGSLGDDDFCWELNDVLDNPPGIAPPDFNAPTQGSDERFGPT